MSVEKRLRDEASELGGFLAEGSCWRRHFRERKLILFELEKVVGVAILVRSPSGSKLPRYAQIIMIQRTTWLANEETTRAAAATSNENSRVNSFLVSFQATLTAQT